MRILNVSEMTAEPVVESMAMPCGYQYWLFVPCPSLHAIDPDPPMVTTVPFNQMRRMR